MADTEIHWAIFLSTPSARRATETDELKDQLDAISIHALREEGDIQPKQQQTEHGKFLSTPSARRATLLFTSSFVPLLLFLSTPSARRATGFVPFYR